MAFTSVNLHSVGFAIKFGITFLRQICVNSHTPLADSSFLLLSAFSHIGFPTISLLKPAVKEVVTLLAGNLKADETEAFFRDNGLLTFAADDRFPE